jgi:hypothetical protein
VTAPAVQPPPAAIHHAALYGSDDDFLAMAVPFAGHGIARGEAVLAATTAANLELLASALGDDAAHLDQAETAFFGPRPAKRVAAFEKYARGRGGGGRVRVLAEPVWAGRTAPEISDWQRMEAGLNELLTGTGIWMICPYDTRRLPASIIDSALRTHPASVTGTATRPCPRYTDPAAYAARHDVSLPEPPDGAAELAATARLRDIRCFARAQAADAGLDDDAADLMVIAVHETAAYLKDATGSPVVTRIWQQAGAIACDLRASGTVSPGAFDGYRMPRLNRPRPGDGLWYARQVTTRLDLRASPGGLQARLQVPGPRIIGSGLPGPRRP